jgi:stearoyl-CoA desaturase (delta-9 desaturase)
MTANVLDELPEIDPPQLEAIRYQRAPDEKVNWVTSIPFILVHFLPLLLFVTGVTATALAIFFVTYLGRMFFLTATYHRYLAHRSFRLSRFWQFVFVFAAASSAQKGPLWWAAHHRNHHKFSDTDRDIHSPRRGFWWSHLGWILCDKYQATEYDEIKDFAKYPEMRWMNKHDWVAPWTLGVACYLIGGFSGLLMFFASTVVLWHSTFLVNSLAHVFGRRRYETTDTSRNSLLIALVTGGEGWHNNHHRYQSSARQGFRWWQIDTTYYGLWLFSKVGIVRDLRPVPARVMNEARVTR